MQKKSIPLPSSSGRSHIDAVLLACGLVLFAFIFWYSIATNFHYYISESIVFSILAIIGFAFYARFNLDTFTYTWVLIAFALHAFGAFRFYAHSPVGVEWDVVTHFFGIFAATLVLFNIAFHLAGKTHRTSVFLLVILAGAGVGVIIEFIEFIGLMTTGFGEGFLGRGFGDFDPRIISSDYIDTIQDLYWNTLGSVVALLVALWRTRKNPHRKL